MSMCSELTSGRNNEEVARLPILRHSTCSASRNTLLKVEFQQFFGSKGSGARYYNKSLKLKKKTSIEVVHASRVLEYEALDRWLRKHNLTNSSKGHLALTDREFMIFFKWFEMKMKRHCYEDGLNIECVITDFIESGLFKQRAEASHFLRSIDSDGNGSICYEEFMTGLSSESNLHRVSQFKRFIRKLKFGEKSAGSVLPALASRPATADSVLLRVRGGGERLTDTI